MNVVYYNIIFLNKLLMFATKADITQLSIISYFFGNHANLGSDIAFRTVLNVLPAKCVFSSQAIRVSVFLYFIQYVLLDFIILFKKLCK